MMDTPIYLSSSNSEILEILDHLFKNRLIKLTGTIISDNLSFQLRNEVIEHYHLLKKNKISKEHYSAYIQKYITLHDGYTNISQLFEFRQRTES